MLSHRPQCRGSHKSQSSQQALEQCTPTMSPWLRRRRDRSRMETTKLYRSSQLNNLQFRQFHCFIAAAATARRTVCSAGAVASGPWEYRRHSRERAVCHEQCRLQLLLGFGTGRETSLAGWLAAWSAENEQEHSRWHSGETSRRVRHASNLTCDRLKRVTGS